MTHTKRQPYLLPLILVVFCFALWGFANDLTHPMVKVFSNIFAISTVRSSLVQVAFYGGYMLAAMPAASYIRRKGYASGIRLGLWVYLIGGLLFLPAAYKANFYFFLLAYFILTCGLSFLETSCNPYVYHLGKPESATRRLNLAQAFNPLGSLTGMFVAMHFVQGKVEEAKTMQSDTWQYPELWVVIKPYLFVAAVVLLVVLLFYVIKMPNVQTEQEKSSKISIGKQVAYLFKQPRFRFGAISQFFYVGAQIMVWTYIIHYGADYFMNLGYTRTIAEQKALGYNIVGMILFCSFRFVNTALMKKVKAIVLLRGYALMAIFLLIGVMFLPQNIGLVLLVLVSACMSLMYPTIFSTSLEGVDKYSSTASACLVMGIGGGAVLPVLQAAIIDTKELWGLASLPLSFIVPLICFTIIFFYAHSGIKR